MFHSTRPTRVPQVNDHGVWLPGTVKAKQEDTWGNEIFVVGCEATHISH